MALMPSNAEPQDLLLMTRSTTSTTFSRLQSYRF